MVNEGTKRPQASVTLPPRKLNVRKYAESRASELHSLHSIIENRVNGDFRSQRNKRRRTTSFDNQIAKKGSRRKRQKLGIFDKSHAELVSGKDQKQKLSRRVRRRHELRMNPESGFCTSGDGTKRLRTHVWHAKRFTMTKLWGYHLPLGLQGRGRGSRVLLKRFKQGVLVHDASYYTAVQLEGPEDSIISALRMVLVPFPSVHAENKEDSILSGICYGTAMVHQLGAPVSQAIAPVTYMWRPVSLKHGISVELMKHDVSECNKSDSMEHDVSFRQLWVWIHASAFKEAYDTLKLACQKEMDARGILINCLSLEGQLAKLELMGSGTFQLIQKIVHPITSYSENHWPLIEPVATEEEDVSQRSSIVKNEEHFSSSAILTLKVKDPRELPRKRATVSVEPTSVDAICDAQQTLCNELADLEEVSDMNKDFPTLSCSQVEDNESDNNDLWSAATRGLRPPVEEIILSKEKHHKRMLDFCLDDENDGKEDSSTKVQCSRSCPILLLKNEKKGLAIGWSIILPLSWVKAFWISLISSGVHAIGLREKHWIACEMGLPFFPSDFPDCKAYSILMATKAAAFDQKAELRPPSIRPFRVPTPPPWGIVRTTFNKETSPGRSPEVTTKGNVTDTNSILSSSDESSGISPFGYDGSSFDGIIARTGCMLTTFLNDIQASQLLLFPQVADRKTRISKFIKSEINVGLGHGCSIIYDRKLCFLRVHLHPSKKGIFEEGAVVCAPFPSDISLWTSGSVKSEKGLQMPQSAMISYFKEQSSGKWGIHIPDDSIARESHRWPIGFVTTGSVQGSKRLMAEGYCEAVLLAYLREQQWKGTPAKHRKREIYVLVRNLTSVAYRLALASIVLEHQENDNEFL